MDCDYSGAIASASIFAILFAVCATTIIIFVTTTLLKGNMKVSKKLRRTLNKERSETDASVYADVTHQVSSITPHKNIAYGEGLGVSTSTDT